MTTTTSCITIFTDAGYSSVHKVGTWAAWTKCAGKTERYSGILKGSITYNGEAELKAIYNGMFVAAKRFDSSAPYVVVQSDCLEALQAILNGHKRAEDNRIAMMIRTFAIEHNWTMDYRHVKGHKGNTTKRNAVNTWCDKECSRQMGLALERLKNDQLSLELGQRL